MRTIKYRAWDAERKIMCYEFESLSPSMDYGVLVVGRFDKDYYELELMQYTGLKDKNGKEIYEGDILESGDEILKVLYNSSMAAFDVEYMGGDVDSLGEMHMNHVEIIGNICETPELLKDKIQTQI